MSNQASVYDDTASAAWEEAGKCHTGKLEFLVSSCITETLTNNG